MRSRTIHRSQHFAHRRDGTTIMTMTVKGTTELANWIMSMGAMDRGVEARCFAQGNRTAPCESGPPLPRRLARLQVTNARFILTTDWLKHQDVGNPRVSRGGPGGTPINRSRSDTRRLIQSTFFIARFCCLSIFLFAMPARAAAGAPSVVHFSPRGTVKQIRQVTARFSEAMVPLGDPRDTTAPFDIDCPAKGAGRWIDSRNWSYDFEHDLPAGLRCTFKLRAGLKSLAGNAFSDLRAFDFDTGGPSIVDQRPWSGDTDIDEEQAFVLILDAEPDPASITDHASFSVEGMPQTIGATIMNGADRDILLKRFSNLTANKTVVILQARQRFPNNTAVTLIWGKGIKSKSGIATVEDQTIGYKTRKLFEAAIRCERESAKSGCIPLTPITLSFSARDFGGAGEADRASQSGRRETFRRAQRSRRNLVTFFQRSVQRIGAVQNRDPAEAGRWLRARTGERVALSDDRRDRRVPAARQVFRALRNY